MMRANINKPGKYRYFLDREGQTLELVGRFQLSGRAARRWDIEIIHAAPRTSSRTSIKGVVDDEAQALVYGTIKVFPQAVGTEAFLEERMLLVSADAKAQAVPNLEIATDDVRCSHAAAVGRIDEEQLFYLTSRGISPDEAKKMIVDGFLKS